MTKMARRRMIKESRKTEETQPSQALAKRDGTRTLELTKALRHEYAAVEDLIVTFRRFAVVTSVGSAADAQQAETLRMEASILAAEVKSTVPTAMWDWLCKILHDEHMKNEEERKRNREKVLRYYGKESNIPEPVRRFYSSSGTLELTGKK